MKKYLSCIILGLALLSQPVFAKTIAVEAINGFSTEQPPEKVSVKFLEDVTFDENLTVKAENIVEGKIVDVTDPKRLKRNATFSFIPLNYTDENGQNVLIKDTYQAKYTTKVNKGQLAKSVGLGVGSLFVKGLSIGYSAVEGAIKNEKDNRFKSSVNEVYQESPLSYVEKGEELIIEKGQIFFLNFKTKEEEKDVPNYEYTELSPSNNVK